MSYVLLRYYLTLVTTDTIKPEISCQIYRDPLAYVSTPMIKSEVVGLELILKLSDRHLLFTQGQIKTMYH